MTSRNWERAKSFTLGDQVEGGWSHVRNDRGGETYCGIARVFHPLEPIWIELDKRRPHPRGIKYPELDAMVDKFYRDRFWEQSGAPLVPFPLSTVMFDHEVNSGSGAGKKALQRALGVEPDGQIGPKTLSALSLQLGRVGGLRRVANKTLDQRVQTFVRIMRKRNTQLDFALGWWRRTLLVQQLIADNTKG